MTPSDRLIPEFLAASLLLLAAAVSAWHEDLGLALTFALPCMGLVVARSWLVNGMLHPLTLTLATSSAYIAAGPVEIVALPPAGVVSAQPMTVLLVYGLCFVVFARFVGEAALRAADGLRLTGRTGKGRFPLAALWLAFACCLAVPAAVVGIYGVDIGGITRADLYANEQSALSAARIVTAALAVIGYASWREHVAGSPAASRTPLACLVGAFVLFAAAELLILGDRRLLMSTALGIACAHGARRVPTYLTLAALPMLAILIAYGFVRNRPPEEWSTIFDSLDALSAFRPSNMEFGGFMVVAEMVLSQPVIPQDFPTYPNALLQVFPRSILPDRPEAPSEWFIRTYFADLAALGYGYGFNAIIESVANFGPVGPAALGAAAGALLAVAGRGRLASGLAAFLAVFLMRLDMASLLKSTILVLVAVAVVIATRCALAVLDGARPPSGSEGGPT